MGTVYLFGAFFVGWFYCIHCWKAPLSVSILSLVVIRSSAYLDQTIVFAFISTSDHLTAFKMGGLRVNAPCSVLSSLPCHCGAQLGPVGP